MEGIEENFDLAWKFRGQRLIYYPLFITSFSLEVLNESNFY